MKYMKTQILVAVCLFPLLCHSETEPSDSPKDPAGFAKQRRKMEGAVERMPEELKERFKAAREAAMKNPKVVELQAKAEAAAKEFHAMMREEMQKIDPELKESVRGMLKKDSADKGGDRRIWSLSAGEKERLEAARAKVKELPEVKAALEGMKSAETPEDREAAMRKFHEVMRAELLKLDPSLEGLLDKMKPPKIAGDHTSSAKAMLDPVE